MSETLSTIDFEKSLVTLETLVEQLERGELTLEQSLQQFEQGIVLVRQCQNALQTAEQKVMQLIEDKDGFTKVPYQNHAVD